MSETIEQSGACHCRNVKFQVKGNVVLNMLCHCKNCSHNRGSSPVHLMGVAPADGLAITEGNEKLSKAKAYGTMVYAFCSMCGCLIYAHPEGENFRAVLPTNFHIENGVSCKLPEEYLPKVHVNYENRQYDWKDNLPKYKTFPPDGVVDNEGNEVKS